MSTILAECPTVVNGECHESIVIRLHAPGKLAVCSRLRFGVSIQYHAGAYFANTPDGMKLATAEWFRRSQNLINCERFPFALEAA